MLPTQKGDGGRALSKARAALICCRYISDFLFCMGPQSRPNIYKEVFSRIDWICSVFRFKMSPNLLKNYESVYTAPRTKPRSQEYPCGPLLKGLQIDLRWGEGGREGGSCRQRKDKLQL